VTPVGVVVIATVAVVSMEVAEVLVAEEVAVIGKSYLISLKKLLK